VDIGELFGVGYSTVRRIRKRLSRMLVHDRNGRRNREEINRKITI
jgi:hypothetical protein